MVKREKDLFNNIAFKTALLMDPRWNVALHPSQVEEAIESAILLYEQKLLSEKASTNFEGSMSDNSNISVTSDDVETMLRSMDKAKAPGTCEELASRHEIRSLLKLFLNEKRVDRKVNVVDWWTRNSIEKPLLFEIAKIALAVPPTQVSVERLFSGAKFIMNPQRNRLDADTFRAVMLIRSNNFFKKGK